MAGGKNRSNMSTSCDPGERLCCWCLKWIGMAVKLTCKEHLHQHFCIHSIMESIPFCLMQFVDSGTLDYMLLSARPGFMLMMVACPQTLTAPRDKRCCRGPCQQLKDARYIHVLEESLLEAIPVTVQKNIL